MQLWLLVLQQLVICYAVRVMKRLNVRPYVRLSVPSIDSSSGGRLVCC